MDRKKIREELLRTEMLAHIKNYKKSGLTQSEYCRTYMLSYAKLAYWLRKFRSEI